MITIRQVTPHDVDLVAPLFDAYRQFYGQTPDLDLARTFLSQRLLAHESVVLVAEIAATMIGFTQLYPSFSTTRASSSYILNDLYVVPEHRRSGAARRLLTGAAEFSAAKGITRLSLSTAHSNIPAQKLYESLGWVLDEQFRTYSLRLGA